MADELVGSRAHPPGERSAGDLEAVPDQLTVDSFAGKISVQWAPQEAVTPLGQLPFFVDFLKQSGVIRAAGAGGTAELHQPQCAEAAGRAGDAGAEHGGGRPALRTREGAALRRGEPGAVQSTTGGHCTCR